MIAICNEKNFTSKWNIPGNLKNMPVRLLKFKRWLALVQHLISSNELIDRLRNVILGTADL